MDSKRRDPKLQKVRYVFLDDLSPTKDQISWSDLYKLLAPFRSESTKKTAADAIKEGCETPADVTFLGDVSNTNSRDTMKRVQRLKTAKTQVVTLRKNNDMENALLDFRNIQTLFTPNHKDLSDGVNSHENHHLEGKEVLNQSGIPPQLLEWITQPKDDCFPLIISNRSPRDWTLYIVRISREKCKYHIDHIKGVLTLASIF